MRQIVFLLAWGVIGIVFLYLLIGSTLGILIEMKEQKMAQEKGLPSLSFGDFCKAVLAAALLWGPIFVLAFLYANAFALIEEEEEEE